MDIRSTPIVLALALALSGCFGDGQGGPAEGPDGAGDALPNDQAGAEGNQNGPRGPVTWPIEITDSRFVDGTITIQAGDTVEWTTRDSFPHTVTANNGEFDSGYMVTGPIVETFAFTFADVGEYPYHCQLHSSMEGTITVVEPLDGVS